MRYGDNKKRNGCKTKKERKKPNRIKWHCFYCSCYISDPLITVILMLFTISQQQLHLSRELKLEQQQSHDNNKEQEGACQNVSVIREKNTEGECTKRDYHQINTTVYWLEMLLSASDWQFFGGPAGHGNVTDSAKVLLESTLEDTDT